MARTALAPCGSEASVTNVPNCFSVIDRAMKYLVIALDPRSVNRENCIINCIKAAWERIKKCRSGFGNYYPMPWEEIKLL